MFCSIFHFTLLAAEDTPKRELTDMITVMQLVYCILKQRLWKDELPLKGILKATISSKGFKVKN